MDEQTEDLTVDTGSFYAPRGPERRRERRFLVIERRSGFDRRRSQDRTRLGAVLEPPLLRLRGDPRLLAEVLVLVNLLSVIDLLITLSVLHLGAVELNPVMAYLFTLGPATAAVAKIGAVCAATLGLWLLRTRRAALMTALFLLAAFGTLVLYELVGIARLA